MISRRAFIKTTSLASLSAFTFPSTLSALEGQEKNIGLQLYTLRDQVSKDLRGTLEKVAAIGYRSLEAAGYENGRFYGHSPAELASMAADLGMEFISSHAMVSEETASKALDAHAALGVKYIVYPVLPSQERNEADHYKAAAAFLNEMGIFFKMANIGVGYHNHDFEFQKFGKETGYDILLDETQGDLVSFQLDIYWMCKAGHDPIKYFRKHPGRFETWHVKDMAYGKDQGFTEVGSGQLPYQKYFNYRGSAGMHHFFVEQDQCDGDPMESVTKSFNHISKKLSF